jgi:hypothetical protein
LRFEVDALRELATLAMREKTGARGLVSVMEKTLLHFEKKLPSTDIKYLVVDVDMVHDPKAVLELLLKDKKMQNAHQKRYEELKREEFARLMDFILASMGNYLEEHGILSTPTRLELMARQSQEQDADPRDICDLFVELIWTIQDCAEAASQKSGIKVVFSEEAIDRLLAKEPRQIDTLNSFCEEVLGFMEYGLRLMSQKRGITKVVIPAEGVDMPEKFINSLVAETFKVE